MQPTAGAQPEGNILELFVDETTIDLESGYCLEYSRMAMST